MKAGRELDALIAEKVFGLKIEWEHYAAGSRPMVNEEDVSLYMTPHYSTQIADAWLVVEKMLPAEIRTIVNDTSDGLEWVASLGISRAFVKADTAPLAICLAALKAVGEGDESR